MKEENKEITLKLGDVTWNKILGVYYIDMRPSIIHYTDNIYDGRFDENGVPLINDGLGELYYSPVNICQYAFMVHANFFENKNEKDKQTLSACIKVLENMKTETASTVCWIQTKYNKRYDIQPPWVGAMDQGQALSFYTRYYQLTNEIYYLQQAEKIAAYFDVNIENGGFKRFDENGNIWFEEYPSSEPSFVLNGFIYALYGLIDFYRITEGQKVKKTIDRCFNTLTNNLHKYDSGYWSYYDQLKKELVRYYYQKNVHVPQLKSLFILTENKVFNKYALKWEKNLNNFNYLLVQLMYRVLPRLNKFRYLFK